MQISLPETFEAELWCKLPELIPEDWPKRCVERLEAASERRTLSGLVSKLQPLHVRLELLEGHACSLLVDPQLGSCVIRPQSEVESEPDVTISGAAPAWAEVLDGTVSYVEQVNVFHGAFHIEGSAVHLSWLMPVMSEIFSPLEREEPGSRDALAVGVVSGQYIEVLGGQVYLETAGSGPTVLLIHTAGRDARQWHAVMAALSGSFRLIAPDLPGRGRSEGVVGGNGYLDTVEELAAWLRAFMDVLGSESYFVSGCSLGGNLALLLGATDARVSGVLALQGSDYTPTISAGSLEMMRHPRVSLPQSNMNFTMSLIGKDAGADAKASIRRGVDTLNPLAQQADLTAYSRCDTRALMPDVTCPVLLFRGEDDWVVSGEMVRDAASRLGSARPLQVVTEPGIGHFPHVENPGRVAALMLQLSKLTA